MTRREEMLARRAELMAAHPEITEASEFAPLMGDLQQEYWAWQLDRWFAEQGIGTANTPTIEEQT